MTRAMYMSKLYAPTLKEDPADAELASHRLLLRAGMIRKEAAGLYSYLPLAWRSIRKIENIVRDEMDAAGAQELMMPIMVDAELWRESGRIDAYGKELVRFDDRHGREFVLGPTHEETVTALVRNELRSYKQLPVNLYHIQDKFRDEFRPRFGLMRGREFIMKDAYSFSATQESLQEEYDKMKQAYANICERCYIKALPVVADSGEIGGDTSVEYMALAEAGEASLVYCDDCGFAADDEAASTKVVVTEGPGDGTLTKVETPGMGTIEAVAKFFGFPENGTRKSLALIDAEGKPVVAIVPGDHELNDCKAEHVFGRGYRMMTDEELQTYGLHKGFIGPVNLPEASVWSATRACASPSSGPAVPTRSIITLPVPALSATLPSTSGPTWLPSLPAIPARTAASRSPLPRYRGLSGIPAGHQVLRGHGCHLYGRGRQGEAAHHGLLRRWRVSLARCRCGAAQRRARYRLAGLRCPVRGRGDSARSQEGGVRFRLRADRRGSVRRGYRGCRR